VVLIIDYLYLLTIFYIFNIGSNRNDELKINLIYSLYQHYKCKNVSTTMNVIDQEW
jgi:hypothetical protein